MRFALFLLLVLPCIGMAALSFDAEELDFSLYPHYWEMDGLFYFSNSSADSSSTPIFFPIPSDSLNLKAEIYALELVADSLASCELILQGDNGFAFILNLPAQHFTTLRIAYRQQLLGNKATYIITTANSWFKPLSYAAYRLTVDKSLQVSKLPFSSPKQDGNVYSWEFTDFSPSHEFCVEFTR